MAGKMAGKAITRAFLIIALIVTAHVIKPFSIKSITQHLLYSTRSFRFVLPVRLHDRFDHANYLAVNLSNSLFEAGNGIRDFAPDFAPDFGPNVAGDVIAFAPIKVQPLDEVNKSATKQKSGAKKSAPAKRVIRNEKKGGADLPGASNLVANLVARVNSDEIMPVELPPLMAIKPAPAVAPVATPCLLKIIPARVITVSQTHQIEYLIALWKADCEKIEAAPKARMTLIKDRRTVKAISQTVERPGNGRIGLVGSECDEPKTEVSTDEIKIEIVEDVVAPREPEDLKASSLSKPFENCSREP